MDIAIRVSSDIANLALESYEETHGQLSLFDIYPSKKDGSDTIGPISTYSVYIDGISGFLKVDDDGCLFYPASSLFHPPELTLTASPISDLIATEANKSSIQNEVFSFRDRIRTTLFNLKDREVKVKRKINSLIGKIYNPDIIQDEDGINQEGQVSPEGLLIAIQSFESKYDRLPTLSLKEALLTENERANIAFRQILLMEFIADYGFHVDVKRTVDSVIISLLTPLQEMFKIECPLAKEIKKIHFSNGAQFDIGARLMISYIDVANKSATTHEFGCPILLKETLFLPFVDFIAHLNFAEVSDYDSLLPYAESCVGPLLKEDEMNSLSLTMILKEHEEVFSQIKTLIL